MKDYEKEQHDAYIGQFMAWHNEMVSTLNQYAREVEFKKEQLGCLSEQVALQKRRINLGIQEFNDWCDEHMYSETKLQYID
jgi:hypothetical protein